MLKIYGLPLAASLAIAGCMTTQKAGVSEFLCEGLCTSSTAKGSIQRIGLAFRNQDASRAWQGLNDLCREVQAIGASARNKPRKDALLVAESKVVDGSTDYGLRAATKERDCEERLVTPVGR